ncbi:MAG: DUF362 domain-containing protein [Candidatus Eiseniibacteriota bacterium]
MIDPRTVVFCRDPNALTYPESPFSPGEVYPEYPFANVAGGIAATPNPVYALFRGALFALGLDRERFGLPTWNPLGELVRPGQNVLLKPNFVQHFHGRGGGTDVLLTHGSILRAALDYATIALRADGRFAGRISIGDAPLQRGDFPRISEIAGLPALSAFYAAAGGPAFEIVDFRRERAIIDETNWIVGKDTLGGDPTGYRAVAFHERSLHAAIDRDHAKYRVTNYDPSVMSTHHGVRHHEYLIPQTVLSADLVINLPKWKSHHKAALTGALKNLVGINGQKDWLPHHRRGSVAEGGDEYLERNVFNALHTQFTEWEDTNAVLWQRRILKLARRGMSALGRATSKTTYREGSWYGNDTLWRTILDLNRALLYADREGVLHQTAQRRVLSIVDGIVAGEGQGPLSCTERRLGALVAGSSSAAVDVFLARLMGFDYRKTPSVARAFDRFELPLAPSPVSELVWTSDDPDWQDLDPAVPGRSFEFVPPSGWRGAIELGPPRPPRAGAERADEPEPAGVY